MENWDKKRIREIYDLIGGDSFSIIALLLMKGHSVNLNKVKIIKYILNKPNRSMNELSTELKIDYKNVWRICQELDKIGILKGGTYSQGKKAELEFKKQKALTEKEKEKIKKAIN
jgi:hypothetical protein